MAPFFEQSDDLDIMIMTIKSYLKLKCFELRAIIQSDMVYLIVTVYIYNTKRWLENSEGNLFCILLIVLL